VFPVGIGLRDPRSQTRDLGHPSISPFDIAEGTSFVISLPTRNRESAARYDKGEGGLSGESGVNRRPRPLSPGSVALTFVISTEAKRSGEISVLTPLPGDVFRPERSVVERSAVSVSEWWHESEFLTPLSYCAFR